MATYYVAAAGSDLNPGTSSAAPWRTLSAVNTTTKSPGDRFLFNRGDTFSGTLTTSAAGTALNAIYYGDYGSGAKPIVSCGNDRGVYLQNLSFVTVQNIEIGGIGVNSNGTMSDASNNQRPGIDVESTLSAGTLTDVRLLNCKVSGCWSGVKVHADAATTPVGFANVEIGGTAADPFDVRECLETGIWFYSSPAHAQSSTIHMALGQQHSNAWVHHCTITHIYGTLLSGGSPLTTLVITGTPLTIWGTTTALVEFCEISHSGVNGGSVAGGPVAVLVCESDAVTVQFVEAHHMEVNAGAVDGMGIDLDGGTTNCIVQDCYAHDNYGSGYGHGPFAGNTQNPNGNIFRFNIAENNGGTAAIHNWGPITNVLVERNTFSHIPSGDYAVLHDFGGGWHFRNNVAMTRGAKVLAKATNGGGGLGVFEGNRYWNPDGARFADDTHTQSGGTYFTTLAGFRTSTNLVVPPETKGGVDCGSFGDPALSNPGAGGTISDLANMNRLLTAYDPANGGVVNTAGVTGGSSANDFHGNAPISGRAVGAVEYHASVTGGVSRSRMQLSM